MVKDYANNSKTKSSMIPGFSYLYRGGLMFFWVVAAGLIIFTGWYLIDNYIIPNCNKLKNTLVSSNHTNVKSIKAVKPVKLARQDKNKLVKFEFYSQLPKMKVDIDSSQKNQDNPLVVNNSFSHATAKVVSATVVNNRIYNSQLADESNLLDYYLQAGSFRNIEQAKRLVGYLRRYNYTAYILTTEPNEGKIWYKVRLGPYNDFAQVSKVKQNLASVELNSIVLRAVG